MTGFGKARNLVAMSKLREFLFSAAGELGLRVESEHTIVLADGTRLTAEAFFPDLGGPTGIAVFSSDDLSAVSIEELLRAGHTASFIGEPGAREVLEIDGYARMFAEWGWTGGPDRRPFWMETPKTGDSGD